MDRTVNAGASLVEVLIGIAIIFFAVIIGAKFTKNTLSINKDAQAKTDACYVAEMKLADLSAAAINASSGSDTYVLNNQTYNRSWTITKPKFIQQAKITVSWTAMGKSRQFNYIGALQ